MKYKKQFIESNKVLLLAKIFISNIANDGSYDHNDRISIAKHLVKQIEKQLGLAQP